MYVLVGSKCMFSVGSTISDAENEPHVLNASICKSYFSKTIVDLFYLGSLT